MLEIEFFEHAAILQLKISQARKLGRFQGGMDVLFFFVQHLYIVQLTFLLTIALQ